MAGISADGKQAFWYGRNDNLLEFTDLVSFEKGELKFLVHQSQKIEWCRKRPSFIYWNRLLPGASTYEVDRSNLRDKMDMRTTGSVGAGAKQFVQGPNPDELILITRDADKFYARKFTFGKWSAAEPGIRIRLFESVAIEKHHHITAATLSEDGQWLAVGIGGTHPFLQVIDLETGKEKLLLEKEVQFLSLNRAKNRMIGVKNTAAFISIHDYNLESGTETTKEVNGFSQVTKLTPDFDRVFMGLSGEKRGAPHIVMYSTAPFKKLKEVRFPRERSILDIHVKEDGGCLAIGRSGRLWEWDPASGAYSKRGWVNPPANDHWLIWFGGALAVFGTLLGSMTVLRKRCPSLAPTGDGDAPVVAPKYQSSLLIILLMVILLELGKLILNLARPMDLTDALNFYFVLGHVIVASGVFISAVLIAILRMPTKWKFLTPIVLVLGLGAAFDLLILYIHSASAWNLLLHKYFR